MEAKKLDLSNYEIDQITINRETNERESKKIDYDVKEILVNIILHPSQGHKGFRFYTVDKVARKIHDSVEDVVLLDSTDFSIVKESFDNFSGFGKQDAELVRRVYEAESVELEEKQKKE